MIKYLVYSVQGVINAAIAFDTLEQAITYLGNISGFTINKQTVLSSLEGGGIYIRDNNFSNKFILEKLEV